MRVRFGDVDVSPELGVYYDKSALGIRPTNYIIVPGVSLTPRTHRTIPHPKRLDNKSPPRF